MDSNKKNSRRGFIKKSGILITASTLTSFNNLSASKSSLCKFSKGELSGNSKKFMKMFDLKYPIIQAPTAGPAEEALAIAVANSGAFAALPLSFDSVEVALKKVKEVKSNTSGSFYINYILNFFPQSLDKVIAAGIKTVQFSWGLPSTEIVEKLKKNSIKMGIQVTSKQNAIKALELNPDYLVCQGIEAGGHIHASKPLILALKEVLSVAGKVPVAASGGISTGHDIKKYIDAGAAAAVLGTRFVATKESFAHQEYKETLMKSSAEDTVFTVCLNKGWGNATHRIIRNETFNMWEAAGCPKSGLRPGEKDIIAEKDNGTKYERYQGMVPLQGMKGNVKALGMYAGEGVGNIKDIPSAGELLDRLWKEFNN